MITNQNITALLSVLGYIQNGSRHTKTFGAATLEIDFSKKEIIYPEAQGLVVNERQTCNFSANENFVVFECVHRLLEKGYKPEHIELEPKWKLGHGASGGRADILIKDNAGKPLLIIECKTPDSEFKKAWNKTLQDGDQLFSYAQQIQDTQFLCLYASDFDETASIASYISYVIAHRDNDKYLDEQPGLKGFKHAADIKERYAVWRDTYKLDYTTKGIFESNIQPYHIGKDKYSLADLSAISAADQQKKYHEFATILRQHNVSGRENAFDKLVNLFLCKLVDETVNPHDLKFYWKGVAYDTHFDLLDRLQQLYQAGMGKFLGEAITYIDQSAVRNAMRFIKQNPDATQKAVWQLFQQQKFFTNNDFSLIDVHNEKLFYQNAEVLLKILQMWQDIRLTNPGSHNQFLGDMFEGFLDQGVKQSEGQYFTPMPICRFILMSLPLKTLVGSATPPKAIDYACGAGHFLNELALQIQPLLEDDTRLADYHRAIYGIEKEYRLSKVAKVSAFMYGQQDINICYGDALIHQHAAFPEIKNDSFDLLVANPPYSVKGFLETLSESERNAYRLTGTIGDLETANSIETFFIERAKQLLKAGGIAALILPSSILSNGGNTYVKTREILLQYFDLVAIAEFGSGTFGKTGTNTVTLFLRRKRTAPDTAEHYWERVKEWFKGCDNNKRKQVIYKDAHLIDQYAAHIGVAAADYKTLLAGAPNAALLAHETFTQYRKAFDASSDTTRLKAQKSFKALTPAEQQAELDRRFLKSAQDKEFDKLHHFVMACDQPNPVLVIRSPSESKAQKQFLGYDWSSAKGDEGIKLIKDAHGHHLTQLYDETNRDNAAKLNRLIADNFDGTLAAIPESLSAYAHTTRLVDMLDFSRVGFEKQIALTAKKSAKLVSHWPLFRLGELCHLKAGGTPSRAEPSYWGGSIRWLKINDFKDFDQIEETTEHITEEGLRNSAAKLLVKGTVVVTIFATIGRVAMLKNAMTTNQAIVGLSPIDPSKLSAYYLMYAIKQYVSWLEQQAVGMAQPNINQTKLSNLQIPLPPPDIQHQIVTECEAVDVEAAAAQAKLQQSQIEIAALLDKRLANQPRKRLEEIAILSRGASPRPIDAYITDEINGVPWIKIGDVAPGEKYIRTTAQKITQAGAEKSRRVQKGDFIISNSMSVGRPYILDIDGCVHDGWLIVSDISPEVAPQFLYYALSSDDAQNQFKSKALGGVVQNLNIERAKSVSIAIPSMKQQRELVIEIEALERTIAAAQATLAAAPARKQAIMQRYL